MAGFARPPRPPRLPRARKSGAALDRAAAAIEAGDFPGAIRAYEDALRGMPRSPELHNDLANAYRSLWRIDESLDHYRRAIEIRPDFASAHHNLGVTLLDVGQLQPAAEALERARELRPGHSPTLRSLMLALTRLRQHERALPWLEHFRAAAAAAPRDVDARKDHALALTMFERMDEAADVLGCALELRPGDPEILTFLGLTLQELARYDEALRCFDEALIAWPESGEVRFYRSLELLRQGDFEQGFAEYEWRWRHPGFPSPRPDFQQPLWDGSAFPGRTILLHTEQGLGDAIQFVRYAALVKPLGGRVVLSCERALARLLQGCAGIDEVVVKGDALPPFDVHAPLLSLPGLLGTRLDSISSEAAYLPVPPVQARLPERRAGARLRIGISWAGSRGHAKDRLRSCSLATLDSLLALEDVEVVSLQRGPEAAEIARHPAAGRILNLGPDFQDLRDTAGAIAQLDLVITVDTAIAHLAGALGCPTWVLTPFDADWRWMVAREDSPWYPSLRLFRQQRAGEWAEVIERVVALIPTVEPRSDADADADADTAVAIAPLAAKQAFDEAVRRHLAGDADAAERGYARVLELDAAFPEAHNNLGVLLRSRGDEEASTAAFRRAVELRASYPEAQVNLGLALTHAGRHAEAVACFRALLRHHPDHPEALANLGAALVEMRCPLEAVEPLRAAARLLPDHPEAANNLGNALLLAGRSDEAVAEYRRSLALRPDYPEALNNLGAALRAQRDPTAAVPLLRRALELRPDYLDALQNLALALPAGADTGESERIIREAVERNAGRPAFRAMLALMLEEQARFADAEDEARAVLDADATIPEAWAVLGICRAEQGDFPDALRCYDRALALDPLHLTAHWNRGLALLMLGDYAEGWLEYEWRWKMMFFVADQRDFPQPAWSGEPLNGRTILVYTEQGLGDGIQFIRFARMLRALGAGRIVVEAQEALVPLFREIPWLDEVVARGAPLPAFDLHAPLLSLPHRLGITLENLDAEPYLSVGSRPVEWQIAEGPELKVGLVWEGRAPNANLARRSLQLAALEPLLQQSGARFYSLQKGDAAAHLAAGPHGDRITDLAPYLHDFVDTAAAIRKLDLVITIDTSVAHLAAALGTPTWVMLMHTADWRWLQHRPTSPWYTAARLFRQPAPGNWGALVAQVADELASRLADRDPTATGSPEAEAVTILESAQRDVDGLPRVTLRLPIESLGEPGAFDLYEREMVEGGADPEIRYFLDEQLADGDVLVDVGAGWGLVSLGAAAAPDRSVRVFSIVDDAGAADRLRRNAAANRLTGDLRVTAVAALADTPVDSLAPCDGGRVFLRCADAADLPGLLSRSAALVESGRLAAVIWPAAPDEDGSAQGRDAIMLGGLSSLDYQHFNLTSDEDGPLLVPHGSDPSAAGTVFSLAPELLSTQQHEGSPAPSAVEQFPPESAAEPQGLHHPMPLSRLRERVASLSEPGEGRLESAQDPARAPTAPPALTELAFDWQLGSSSGWGVYGLNLALHALGSGVAPTLLSPPDARGLTPLQRLALEPALLAHAALDARLRAGSAPEVGGPVLRALGNGLQVTASSAARTTGPEVGVVFFEDTALDRAALDRAAGFHRIVAGSTWNADVLRDRGLRNVEVCLQGIDPSLFHPAPRTGILAGRFVVFSGGKLEYRKGQDLVVAAFRHFLRRHPDSLLMVAWHNHWPRSMAEIPLRGHVQGTPAVDRNGLLDVRGWLAANGIPAGSVVDLGLTANAMMGQAIREADLAIFPNRCEGGTNLVAMECLASGVPTVLSANTGHLDLLSRAPAYALERQDAARPSAQFAGVEGWGESSVEELVEVMEQAYSRHDEALERARIAAEAMRQLSWANQIRALLSILGGLR